MGCRPLPIVPPLVPPPSLESLPYIPPPLSYEEYWQQRAEYMQRRNRRGLIVNLIYFATVFAMFAVLGWFYR
jgi:hypothetical protein